MEHRLLLTLVLIVLAIISTAVNRGKPFWCARAKLFDVRIEGCIREPCQIVKGTRYHIWADFEFQTPNVARSLGFQGFAGYWARPNGSAFGSPVTKESDCRKLLGCHSCPAKANTQYTLKSFIYTDPEARDTLNRDPEAEKMVEYSLRPMGRENNQSDYSVCSFTVDMQFVNKKIKT